MMPFAAVRASARRFFRLPFPARISKTGMRMDRTDIAFKAVGRFILFLPGQCGRGAAMPFAQPAAVAPIPLSAKRWIVDRHQ